MRLYYKLSFIYKNRAEWREKGGRGSLVLDVVTIGTGEGT